MIGTDIGSVKVARNWLISPHSIRARFARNTLWAMAGSAVSQGSALIAVVMLGRILGVERFGQLALIQSTVLMLGTFGEAGLGLTTTRFVARWRTQDPARAGRFIGSSLLATSFLALLMVFVLMTVEPRITRSSGTVLSTEFRAGFGLLVFDMLNRIQLGTLSGLEAFGASTWIHMSRGLLLLPGVYLGAHYGGLFGAIVAMGAVSFAVFGIGHRILAKQCAQASIQVRYSRLREPGVYMASGAVWAGGLLLSGSSWAATVLLAGQPHGLTELGLYNAADKWKLALLFLPNVLFQVILPMLSHSHAEKDYRACGRIIAGAFGSSIAVTGAAALFMYLAAGALMSSYGAGFARGTDVLTLAAAGGVAGGIYTVGSGALWAIGKPSHMLGADIFRSALFVGLCMAGLATSARGVMMASLVSFLLGACVLVLLIRKQLQTQ
jgi:O-antigen/teichoic acid export membrane protein